MLDLAAARARQVALEQRLQLDDQRELLAFGQPLAHQVPTHARALPHPDRHEAYLRRLAPTREGRPRHGAAPAPHAALGRRRADAATRAWGCPERRARRRTVDCRLPTQATPT